MCGKAERNIRVSSMVRSWFAVPTRPLAGTCARHSSDHAFLLLCGRAGFVLHCFGLRAMQQRIVETVVPNVNERRSKRLGRRLQVCDCAEIAFTINECR